MHFPDPWSAVAYVVLVSMGIVFNISQRNSSGRSFLAFCRPIFRSKHSFGIIFGLCTFGVAVGMASCSPPIPEEFFYLSYALLLAAMVWSIGAFLTSSLLVNKKVENRKSYRSWQVSVPIIIMVFGSYCIRLVHSIQVGRDLFQLNGLLIPANDPDPITACSGVQAPKSALRFYFGKQGIILDGQRAVVVGIGTKDDIDSMETLLGINREPDGNVSVQAKILGEDNKPIIVIDRNHFEINRNKSFDSLSPPRPDESTLRIKDEYGNTLTVRLINEHAVSFKGKLYIKPGQFVEIDDETIHLSTGEILDRFCLHLTNPKGGGLIGVEK